MYKCVLTCVCVRHTRMTRPIPMIYEWSMSQFLCMVYERFEQPTQRTCNFTSPSKWRTFDPKRSTDVNQNAELGNVNSTDVWTILSNVSKSGLRSPKRSQCESTFSHHNVTAPSVGFANPICLLLLILFVY